MIRRSIDWSFVGRAVGRIFLPLWFSIYGLLMAQNLISHGFLFIDIGVYREAAQAAIDGRDPWMAQAGDVSFAGPPPTLLLFLPLAFVPLELAIVIATTVLVVAAVWSVRRLELPLWWVLFPPVLEGLIVGNPDVLVLAFLLVRGPLAGLAVIAKVYGVIPLILQRRWRSVAVGVMLSALTLPLWPAFLADAGQVFGRLDVQSEGYSAWGTWWMIPAVAALWVLRRRGAEWLVVPAIWPHTQTHYGAMSLPIMRHYPIAAAIVGLGTPLAPVIAVIVIAVQVRLGIGRLAPAEEPA